MIHYISMRSIAASTVHFDAIARDVDGPSACLVPEMIALPEQTSISLDAIEEQTEKMRRRRTQNAARRNRLLITIVCLTLGLYVNPAKKCLETCPYSWDLGS